MLLNPRYQCDLRPFIVGKVNFFLETLYQRAFKDCIWAPKDKINEDFFLFGIVCAGGLIGCNVASEDEISRKPDNQCYFNKVTPAEISSRVETRLAKVEARDNNGNLISPAEYETKRTQIITKPRLVKKIDAVCPEDLTTEFVSSLQRAFRARGLFAGVVNGTLDLATRRAIRDFQTVRGIESATLAKATAQELGLVSLDLE